MFGASCPKLWYRLILISFCFAFIFSWLVPTAVAQTNQTGIITGTVLNGTTENPAPEGTQVTLHAYNSSYTATETFTALLDANGRFQFTLTNKPDDWVYMVSADYQDLSFSSTIASLSGAEPLDLSLTVYDATTDPANVVVDQLSITLTTLGESVQVSELYSFANEGTAVFIGSSDQPGIQINLPAAAQMPTFEHGMGPNSGFFPANELVQQNGRWQDNTPLRPGPNSLTLRVTYNLPANALDLSRTLPYPTRNVLLAVPDGLTFAADGWHQQATQSAGERGATSRYTQSELAAGSTLQFTFSADEAGSTSSSSLKNPPLGDWVLSVAILLLMTTVALRLLRPGVSQTAVPQLATPAGAVPSSTDNQDKVERFQLLFALADLDTAYKNGQLSEAEYNNRRQEIKSRLRTIWEVV